MFSCSSECRVFERIFASLRVGFGFLRFGWLSVGGRGGGECSEVTGRFLLLSNVGAFRV